MVTVMQVTWTISTLDERSAVTDPLRARRHIEATARRSAEHCPLPALIAVDAVADGQRVSAVFRFEGDADVADVRDLAEDIGNDLGGFAWDELDVEAVAGL